MSFAASGFPTEAEGYELLGSVGRGAFATVYLAKVTVGAHAEEKVAIKVLNLDELDTSWEEIRKEITIMSMLDHPNVVKSHCSFVEDLELWLVMPLLSGGACADAIKRRFHNGIKDEAAVATILRETLRGLEYFHSDGRIHRDIKASNILLSKDGEVQIADFGVAGSLLELGQRKRIRKTFTGTPCWMAPEVMEQARGHDAKADIWSFGITALELAYGRPPYAKHRPMKVMLMILQHDPPTPDLYEEDQSVQFSKSFRDLVACCLQKDASKRPAAKKLLQHKFFKQAKKPAYIVEKIVSALPAKMVDSQTGQVLPRSVQRRLMGDEKDQDKPVSCPSWKFESSADVIAQFHEVDQTASPRSSGSDNKPTKSVRFAITQPARNSSSKPSTPPSKDIEKLSGKTGRFTIEDSDSPILQPEKPAIADPGRFTIEDDSPTAAGTAAEPDSSPKQCGRFVVSDVPDESSAVPTSKKGRFTIEEHPQQAADQQQPVVQVPAADISDESDSKSSSPASTKKHGRFTIEEEDS